MYNYKFKSTLHEPTSFRPTIPMTAVGYAGHKNPYDRVQTRRHDVSDVLSIQHNCIQCKPNFIHLAPGCILSIGLCTETRFICFWPDFHIVFIYFFFVRKYTANRHEPNRLLSTSKHCFARYRTMYVYCVRYVVYENVEQRQACP